MPILILILADRIKSGKNMPESLGSDWLLFLITFDAFAIASQAEIKTHLNIFFLDSHPGIFLALMLSELIVFYVVIGVEKSLIYNYFIRHITRQKEKVPNCIQFESVHIGKLWFQKVFGFTIILFFFSYTFFLFF